MGKTRMVSDPIRARRGGNDVGESLRLMMQRMVKLSKHNDTKPEAYSPQSDQLGVLQEVWSR